MLAEIGSDTHNTSTLRVRGRKGVRKKWDVIARRGWRGGGGEGSKCSGRPIFIFFIKENWICAMTRHHANNVLLARNLPFDSDVRQWSHLLMISLHCLWANSNNRTRAQFECDVLYFGFCFVFVWFCSFTCTVRLLFHSLCTFSS